jgi:16S rRNA (uracil1498-N3)-methyltransferase
MADRFYTPHPLRVGEFQLDGPEAHHLATVRRFGPGDRITLFNGDGAEYPAEILSVQKKFAALQILAVQTVSRERTLPLTIAVAIPKGDRADFLVEKLTELGVTHLVPLSTERSVVKTDETKVEKLARAVIEASKQCGRNQLMRVQAPQKWGAFCRLANLPTTRWQLHTGPDLTPLMHASTLDPAGVVLAIGPEGGWSEAELALGLAHGWQSISLGPRILRVETAALAAAARIPEQVP